VSEIADFLRARYAERRDKAESIHNLGCGSIRYDGTCDCEEPAAVIAVLDAKLALIDDLLAEQHEVIQGDCWYTCAAATEERDGGETCDDGRHGGPCDCGRDARVRRRLAILAQPFAGHPDHKGEEWAP